jgi:hypothetical protein
MDSLCPRCVILHKEKNLEFGDEPNMYVQGLVYLQLCTKHTIGSNYKITDFKKASEILRTEANNG